MLPSKLGSKILGIRDVGDHQPRALGGERARIMRADPLGAAG